MCSNTAVPGISDWLWKENWESRSGEHSSSLNLARLGVFRRTFYMVFLTSTLVLRRMFDMFSTSAATKSR
jgi:hypothetical protein